jgi:hypothetical protein
LSEDPVMSEDCIKLRERIVKYAAAGYRRRDIADLCGVSTAVLRSHLLALGIVKPIPLVSIRKRDHHRRGVGLMDGRSLAHQGPSRFEEAEVEL